MLLKKKNIFTHALLRDSDNDVKEFPSYGVWYIYRKYCMGVRHLADISLYCAFSCRHRGVKCICEIDKM